MDLNTRKVVWAVEPSTDPEVYTPVVEQLRMLSIRDNFTVQPTFVLTPEHVPERVDESVDTHHEWQKRYRPAAEAAIKSLIKKSALPRVLPLTILTERHYGTHQSVDALIRYARSIDAELIVAATHAHRGLTRALLGSFAETLVDRSSIPLVLVNPTTRSQMENNSILFATDFSEGCRIGFEQAVHFASRMHLEIILYYKRISVAPVGFPTATNIAVYSEDDEKEVERVGLSWKQWAAERGVAVQVIFDPVPGAIPEAIMRYASESGSGMIGVVAQSGPVWAALTGSVVREIIRNATRPVWVLRSSRVSTAEKHEKFSKAR